MVKEKFKRPIFIILLYLSIPIFMLITNPETLPLPLLVLPFLLLFAALYSTVKITLSRYFSNLYGKPLQAVALMLAGLPVLLILLQSIGQLSARDLLITIGLITGLVFYFRRTDFL